VIEVSNASIDPTYEVTRIFPDADPAFIQTLLAQNSFDVTITVSIMAENGYMKYSLCKEETREVLPDVNFDDTAELMHQVYQQNTLQQLGNDFPFLYAAGIRTFAKRHGFHYKPTLYMLEKELGWTAHEYRIVASGSSSSSSSSSSFGTRQMADAFQIPSDSDLLAMAPNLAKYGMKVKKTAGIREAPHDLRNRMDLRFQQELMHVLVLRRKKREDQDRERAEQVAYELAEREGSLVECGCCFAEYVFEKIVACSEGHLFCCGCLNRFVEQTVFGDGKSNLKCINTTDKCEGRFTDAMLLKSLQPKTYQKLQDALATDALKLAQLDNMVSCHACSNSCQLPDDAGTILKCPGCNAETCKLCGDAAHIPLRCDEVEKKGAQDLRTQVEEAMTKARVRECPNPKCKARFYKVEGCNKMTCTCSWKICYICRKNITKEGYAHFCQAPHCSHKECGKCILFTDSVVDDRQAMKEAGLSTLTVASAAQQAAGGPAKVMTASGKALTGEAAIAALLEVGGASKPSAPAPRHMPPPPGMREPVLVRPHVYMPQVLLPPGAPLNIPPYGFGLGPMMPMARPRGPRAPKRRRGM